LGKSILSPCVPYWSWSYNKKDYIRNQVPNPKRRRLKKDFFNRCLERICSSEEETIEEMTPGLGYVYDKLFKL